MPFKFVEDQEPFLSLSLTNLTEAEESKLTKKRNKSMKLLFPTTQIKEMKCMHILKSDAQENRILKYILGPFFSKNDGHCAAINDGGNTASANGMNEEAPGETDGCGGGASCEDYRETPNESLLF
ncbi:hypothetical protein NPIL_518701 [Nephila pilipes]|uniref:Uncharacterized protein n=1 Tax=Nephila pilipes TaxID=299642 RepID=A0A8X6PP66_NEPPI|nr:hypothetical protein NPIL_518701 [Nephila pilipes]